MRKGVKKRERETMRSEYDFSGGQRGCFAAQFSKGTNLVLLSPDVAAVFPDSDSVNEALRTLIRVTRSRTSKNSRKSREKTEHRST